MRLASTLAAVLCLFGPVVHAGAGSRGFEALYFFYAYRMDVEISAAAARAKNPGEDVETTKPWQIARNVENVGPGGKYANTAADWPKTNVLDTSRPGLNFHAFMESSQSKSSLYGRKAGRKKIADPWFPTLAEVKDIARWDLDSGEPLGDINDEKANRYSFKGFRPQWLYGTLSKDLTGTEAEDKRYTDFRNMMNALYKRTEELQKLDPERARLYHTKMFEALNEARIAREMESGKFKRDGAIKALRELAKKHKVQNLPDSVVATKKTRVWHSAVFNTDATNKYDDLDSEKTKANIQPRASADFFNKAKNELTALAEGWLSSDKTANRWSSAARQHESIREFQHELRVRITHLLAAPVPPENRACDAFIDSI